MYCNMCWPDLYCNFIHSFLHSCNPFMQSIDILSFILIQLTEWEQPTLVMLVYFSSIFIFNSSKCLLNISIMSTINRGVFSRTHISLVVDILSNTRNTTETITSMIASAYLWTTLAVVPTLPITYQIKGTQVKRHTLSVWESSQINN